jgi:hypothetical protein
VISALLEEVTVILTIIWWLLKLNRRLLVSKQRAQKFDMERFNLKKLNDAAVREQYQVKFSNRFSALENLDDDDDDDDDMEIYRG